MTSIFKEIKKLEEDCFGVDIDGEEVLKKYEEGNEYCNGCVHRFKREEDAYNEENIKEQNSRIEFLNLKLKKFQGFLKEFSNHNYNYFKISKKRGLKTSDTLLLKNGIDRTGIYINVINNIYISQIIQELNQLNVDKSLKKANRSINIGLIAIVFSVIFLLLGGIFSWMVSKYYTDINKQDNNYIEQLNKKKFKSGSIQIITCQDSIKSITKKNINLHKQLDSIQSILKNIVLKSKESEYTFIKKNKSDSLKIEYLQNHIQKITEEKEEPTSYQ